jgi:hypothetical protein
MTDKPMTVGEAKDESIYEDFIKKENEFVEDLIYICDWLKREALKDPADHDEIIDLLQRNLSEAFKIRDLAKYKYLW